MLKNEIIPYLDKFGLVEPGPGVESTNGLMYLSEYLIALIRNGQATESDCALYIHIVLTCMPVPGLLQRTPDNQGGQEGPDDLYGVMAACDEISHAFPDLCYASENIPWTIVLYGLKHLGSMNNMAQGKFQWDAVLGRQPQLDAMTLWAAGEFVGPFLRLWTAIVILFSSKGLPDDDTDPRRLSWLLVQVASRHSWISRMVSKIWYRRLYSAYPNGMKSVNAKYFQPTHPLSTYVVDKAVS